jgi:pimeloyl-ACP methyl ester carboxylesterase
LGRAGARFDNRDAGLSTHLAQAGVPSLLRLLVRRGRDAPYRLEDMAGDAVAVLDALGWHSAHVVGRSLGGMIAQTLAIEHPDRVRSLALIRSIPSWRIGRETPATTLRLRFRAVVADCFYGDNTGFTEALGRAGVAYVLAVKPRKGVWALVPEAVGQVGVAGDAQATSERGQPLGLQLVGRPLLLGDAVDQHLYGQATPGSDPPTEPKPPSSLATPSEVSCLRRQVQTAGLVARRRARMGVRCRLASVRRGLRRMSDDHSESLV